MPVWTLANMKGGVAKTTSVLMLAEAARREGRRVLLIDLDLNAQLSRLLGCWPEGQAGAFEAAPVVHALDASLSLVPAPGADFPLDGALADSEALQAHLAPLINDHDLCLIDTPSGYMPFLSALFALTDVWITPTTLAPAVRQASAHYLLRMARQALSRGARMRVRLLPVQFNPHLGSHRVGLESLRRFVGAHRVLPPVRHDGRFQGARVAPAGRMLPIERDYAAVYAELAVS